MDEAEDDLVRTEIRNGDLVFRSEYTAAQHDTEDGNDWMPQFFTRAACVLDRLIISPA